MLVDGGLSTFKILSKTPRDVHMEVVDGGRMTSRSNPEILLLYVKRPFQSPSRRARLSQVREQVSCPVECIPRDLVACWVAGGRKSHAAAVCMAARLSSLMPLRWQSRCRTFAGCPVLSH
jgi:hypothetical protein